MELANLNLFIAGWEAGNRGTFFDYNFSKNRWQKVVAIFCMPRTTGPMKNKIN